MALLACRPSRLALRAPLLCIVPSAPAPTSPWAGKVGQGGSGPAAPAPPRGAPGRHRAPAQAGGPARGPAAPALAGGTHPTSLRGFSQGKKEQKGGRTRTFLNAEKLTCAVQVPGAVIWDAGPKTRGSSVLGSDWRSPAKSLLFSYCP